MDKFSTKRLLSVFPATECWKVSPAKEPPRFFRSLPELVPPGSNLYIEAGGRPPSAIREFLLARLIDDSSVIPGGTLIPAPEVYRILITREHLETLAELGEKNQ